MILKAETIETAKGFFSVFPVYCKGCGLCIEKCPQKCISWSEQLGVYGTPTIKTDPDVCSTCGICETVCPDCAISVDKR